MRSVLLALTLLASTTALFAQSSEVKKLVREAETLAQAGDLPKALESINAAKTRCDAEKGAQCEAYIAFASGSVHQLAAALDHDEPRMALLRKAVAFYDHSLASKETIDALENLTLALIDLGEFDRVLGLTQTMRRVNPDDASDYLVVAAMVAKEIGNRNDAEQFLRQAISEDPAFYDAREALLELHLSVDLASLTPEQRQAAVATVLGLGIELAQNGFADLAIEAYAAVIEQRWQSSEAQALDALVEWVDAHASGRHAVPPLLELPSGWNSAPVAQLRAIVERPENAADQGWWMEDEVRKHTVASLLSVIVLQSEMEPSRAIAVLEAAEKIAPDPTRYRARNAPAGLTWRRSPLFDVLARLAPLYLDNPNGPADWRFDSLTSRLISRSFRSALRGDRITVQRYYAMLGLALDERNLWTGRTRNAGYYLGFAVQWASLENSAEFQPVPDLRRRLAVGLAKKAETNEAAVHYIGAAADYLDIDDLTNARIMYDAAMDLRVFVISPSRRQRIAKVEAALKTRELVRGISNADELTFARIVGRPELAWIFTHRSDDEPFASRQSYKTLMTLAERAEELTGAGGDDAMRFRLEAVKIARDLKALASGVDVENLRKTGRRLILSTSGRSQMQLAPRLSTKQFEKVWTYGGGERVGGFDIGWNDDLFIAADTLRVLLTVPADVRPMFRVDGERITLVPAAAAYDLAPVVDQLKKLDDVKGVTVSTGT